MHLIVRSGIVCEISRAVGSRSESLSTEELADLFRCRAICGRERVEEVGCEGSYLGGTRWWEEDTCDELGRLCF